MYEKDILATTFSGIKIELVVSNLGARTQNRNFDRASAFLGVSVSYNFSGLNEIVLLLHAHSSPKATKQRYDSKIPIYLLPLCNDTLRL